MEIIARNRTLNIDTPKIMGILNVTPDSFSDGGKYNSVDKALIHAKQMIDDGAAIIDIGGESTRPGAADVSAEEEAERVLPVVEAIARELDVMISVDTSQPDVIYQAVNAGAHIWNDIRALTLPDAVETAAALQIPVILMHMQGKPRTMQDAPHYDDVVKDVKGFLLQRAGAAMIAGLRKENIILDPGFGFGKSAEDNFKLLNHLEDLVQVGYPVLSALSRKSMIGAACNLKTPTDRVSGSVAGHLISILKGAQLVRAHDVKETYQAIQVYNAMIAAK